MGSTKISWTNKSWNPTTGCTKIASGCKNYYAESIAKRFWGSRKFSDVLCHPERLNQPASWKKPCMVFVDSMSDLFHESIPLTFFIDVWNAMVKADHHIYQILTKRPERMYNILNYDNKFIPQKHIWLGVSVSTQKDADESIPILLDTPAAVRWVSIEPCLEKINLSKIPYKFKSGMNALTGVPVYDGVDFGMIWNFPVNWVVVGAESGSRKRPCSVEWIESVVAQCQSAGVPVFVKQLNINNKIEENLNNFPAHLRVRKYPEVIKEMKKCHH